MLQVGRVGEPWSGRCRETPPRSIPDHGPLLRLPRVVCWRLESALADFTFVQYPAREQAELRVWIKIPGVWFNGLSGAERSVKYDAEAYDFVDAHVFKKNGKSAQTRWPRTTLRTRRMTRRLMTPPMPPLLMPPLPSEPRTREV